VSGPTGRRLLQALFTALGVIAIATGLLVVVAGQDGIPGGKAASPSVDSELRFFCVFWIAYGVAAVRTSSLRVHALPEEGRHNHCRLARKATAGCSSDRLRGEESNLRLRDQNPASCR
jgi:Domain of unknown function (DUF4345)